MRCDERSTCQSNRQPRAKEMMTLCSTMMDFGQGWSTSHEDMEESLGDYQVVFKLNMEEKKKAIFMQNHESSCQKCLQSCHGKMKKSSGGAMRLLEENNREKFPK